MSLNFDEATAAEIVDVRFEEIMDLYAGYIRGSDSIDAVRSLEDRIAEHRAVSLLPLFSKDGDKPVISKGKVDYEALDILLGRALEYLEKEVYEVDDSIK